MTRVLEPGRDRSHDETCAIATTLGQLGDPAAEPVLIRWLGSEHADVVIASVRALGRVGTMSAIGPLLPLPPTGDPAFDRSVLVGGPAHRALAMLDSETRHAVRECIVAFPDARLRTRSSGGGDLELEIPRILDGAASIATAVRRAIVVAKHASLGARTVPEALALNTRDEIPGVRARCLDVLVDEYARHGLLTETCRAALVDPDVGVRLAAARGLGREGHAALDAIIGDTTAGSWQRLTALELRLKSPVAEAGPVLESLIEDRDKLLRPVAIAAIGARHWLPALERLLALAERPDPACIAPLATTLGQLGDVRAQPTLLRLMGGALDEDLLAVVTALGHVGDIEAIPELETLTHEARTSREIRRAARSAIREIQQRLGPVDAGRVSLVEFDAIPSLEPLTHGMRIHRELKTAARRAIRAIRARLGPADAGRLSLVDLDDATGDLSKADDASGQVSLPQEGARRERP